MAYYTVVTVTPTSEDWIPSYLAEVTPLVHQHGGKYLARTPNHERVEGDGDSPGLFVLLEWPSKEAAEAFYNDPAYEANRKARLAGSESHMFLVEGADAFA
jgi:uncharacterized protein (DUF1330 family)